MSPMETLISILGSIASIGGAIWAWHQANEASSSATKAEKVRDEIIDRRKIIEVSQVHAETKRILNIVSKVGPSCNPDLLTGVDCGSIAKEVEKYSRFINEHSSYFSDLFENRATELCSGLNGDIEALSEAKSPVDKKKSGSNIYHQINSFLPITKKLADEKKENVEVTV